MTRLTAAQIDRRIGVIWALLVFNGLGAPTGQVIPRPVAQIFTMGSLVLALVLVLTTNRRLLVRPNLVLALCSIMAVTAAMAGARGLAGVGAAIRSVRLLTFLGVLWLLTPWWGRNDLLLARCHLRALVVVSGSVLVGLLLFPSAALRGNATGRLSGVLWAIPPTQVGEYAAVLAGMATAMWLSGALARRPALFIDAVTISMVLLSRTRTALVAALVGVLLAGVTLFLKQKRVRRIAGTVLLLIPLAAVALAPALSGWFLRNQSSEQIGGLTGRKQVWEHALAAPRSEFERWFGFGLSDKSFGGLPIDSTWIAVYQDQGLVGAGLVAATLLEVLVVTAFRRAGPERAVATFLVVYCIIASYTEVGLGDVSPYLLHVVVAASLLAGTPWRPSGRPLTASRAPAVM
ncbi:MAG: O-antigen ligase domain-containing protein [Actinomycetota bacterium]|nr:O-antigen ligase domain-containing protein [Actinomycetota bacterium]